MFLLGVALRTLPVRTLRSLRRPLSTPSVSTMVKKIENITKSPEDQRDYRGLILDNELRVLLISDPKTDKSAAALSVNIGHMSDPMELNGLAHFLEHMLFLGTEKYPSENEYSKYLTEHGGSSNAFTSMENTTFYFDVGPEHLDNALDIFSQFFKAPLFTEDATDREVKAVNSEHEKNLANDSWRLHQLERSTSIKDHPYSKFGTGNLQTLVEDPQKNGINVREALLKFHRDYYSSNIMSLVILGKDSLDKLQDTAVNLFGTIENKKVALPKWPGNPFGQEQLQKKGLAVPIKDWRSLSVTFPIPDMKQHYKAGPNRYLGHLIGHESSGSLLSALKKRGWSSHLNAGCRSVARDISFFAVNVDLTEKGLENVDNIVDLIFQYINLLRQEDPKEWIFKEYVEITNMSFRFKDKESPRDYVVDLVEDLLEYPVDEVLTSGYLLSEWKPELINQVLENLTPDNCRIGIISKQFEPIADQTEKWYGTKYKIEDIPSELIEKWKNAKPIEELKLPKKNEFIPSSLDILPDDDNPTKYPAIIHETHFARVWHKKDDEFLLPKSNLIIELTSPFAFVDPLRVNFTHIYLYLVHDALTEYSYDASLASLKFGVVNSKYGLMVTIKGFHDKQDILLTKVLDTLINLEVDEKRYEIFKEYYVRSLKNFQAEQPYTHAMHYQSACLLEKVWLKSELLDATKYLSIEGLKSFIPQFFSMMHIECLIHGNTNKAAAQKLIDVIEGKLVKNVQPLLPPHLLRYRDMKLEDGSNYVYEVTNETHKTSCVDVLLQCPPKSTESNMLLELFVQIASEPCFNVLRTKEQLGYIVHLTLSRNLTGQGVRIMVQSYKHPTYVNHKIEQFLLSMKSYLEEMSDEEFERHKEALAVLRLEKPKKMKQLTNHYWTEISIQAYCFDRDNIEVAFLKTLTKDDVIQFYNDHIHAEGAKRRKLAVHVLSTAEGGAGSAGTEVDEFEPLSIVSKPTRIEDICSFKSGLSSFPLLQPYAYHRPQGSKAKL
ncbi:insulin-degrading enzyme-like isoform X1 [Cloeon dipterum]|uniref:insulin-degrading enzyme-like isoform X1 n=2 Tax=Cloeon dipterum TaxID=197152 RepID=UPI003220129B